MSEMILTETDGPVAIVTINRPEVLNALSMELIRRLVDMLEAYDADEAIRAIVLTGSERAFAAGADIADMADKSAIEMYLLDQFAQWERIGRIGKPLVAAVSGYVLGGGCELAMHCDIIVASETARLGQPELSVGIIPGAGGTQRLTRAVGKFQAMDVILTGRLLTAEEAYRAGLVSRVVPREHYLTEAVRIAHVLAEKPPLAVRMAKEAILKATDTSLHDGLDFERRQLYLLFSSHDQKEGMKAFLEKRRPKFEGR